MDDGLSNEIVLTVDFTAVVIGVITSIIAFMAARRYYGGPWRTTVMWITWGVALFTIRAIFVFSDELVNPPGSLPPWIKYPPQILGFLCMLGAALVMNQMVDFYSKGGRGKFGEDVKKPGKK